MDLRINAKTRMDRQPTYGPPDWIRVVTKDLDLVAFIDESKKPVRDLGTRNVANKGDFYVAASAVVFHGDLGSQRDRIARIESDLGFKLHYGDLSTERRVRAAKAICDVEGWEGYIFESAKPFRGSEHRIRAKLLEDALPFLSSEEGVKRAVLETRSQPTKGFIELDQKDHRVLQKLIDKSRISSEFSIAHETKKEPVLCIADVLAGSRTDYLCSRHKEAYVVLGHRVKAIRTYP